MKKAIQKRSLLRVYPRSGIELEGTNASTSDLNRIGAQMNDDQQLSEQESLSR